MGVRATNVLITSAAAKVPLVAAFRAAAHARGGKVLISDLSPQVETAAHADGFVSLPRSDDPSYPDKLLEACIREDIALLVPTRDAELAVLAGADLSAKAAARGMRLHAHVSSPESVALCRNKLAFARFCLAHDLPVQSPLSIEEARAALPVFARPSGGAGGRGILTVRTEGELDSIAATFNEYIVTALLSLRSPGNPEGAPEFTVDLLRDLSGEHHIGAVVRERVEVVNGESRITRVVQRPDIAALAERIGEALRLVGHNTVQVIDAPEGLLLVEINPRFGGACALGFKAGLHSPERLLAMLAGEGGALSPPVITCDIEMERVRDEGRFVEDVFRNAVGDRL